MDQHDPSQHADDPASDPSSIRATLSDRFDDVRRSLSALGDVIRGTRIDVGRYDPTVHEPLVAFDGVEGTIERERYWVNAPFAFVAILEDPARNAFQYHVVEPSLSTDERALLDTVLDDIRDPLIYRDGGDVDPETRLREALLELLERYGVDVSVERFYRLFYYAHRNFLGYGRLDPIMHDPHVEDISCDGYDLPIFVYHDDYTDIETNVSFDADTLDQFVVRLAQRSGRHISIGDPMVETTLPDGSRAELALGQEVTPRGSAFTIRKYSDEPFTPVDLIEYGTFDVAQLAYLWLAIEHNKSLIFAGGTASGKTTSMNAVSMFIPPRSKILTIEDTQELQLYHDNWLSSVTRERIHEGTDVTMYDLLRSALRHRPEYIAVGEVRGEEAITLFQAMNTGHTTYSTMHADSVQTVINRLENEPINVPRAMVQSLDILAVQTLTRLENGERVRRNDTLAEIEGIDQRTGELDYSTAYTWDGETDTFSESGSSILGDIREQRGWTERELRVERKNREAFLEYVHDRGLSDYRRFTALVNEYYADKPAVLERIGRDDAIEASPAGRTDVGDESDDDGTDAAAIEADDDSNDDRTDVPAALAQSSDDLTDGASSWDLAESSPLAGDSARSGSGSDGVPADESIDASTDESTNVSIDEQTVHSIDEQTDPSIDEATDTPDDASAESDR
ncbi:ATPase, type IV secretory pathway VirB11 component like protein [Halovivax ruber XH-70]|uniref:ATPase, type IV secretory pathway VirB11 component like protein n=1 Tax=Halovivax ruber (strain DSM 18193 / JCM 13892 / XH-70) TaxID=797302 RepID=L0I755_HALRX|nr:type II/IV secretion system ATPase subunit [Halovivax ruber]AGB15385.1 ATPase, type IV secretory pathway VirB11 component like protein [Halovivax ruber XH-70]